MRPLKISRDHLITCAGNELMRVGAGRVTVDRVAADASCAKGLLHYHFSSKDRLLSEALAAIGQRRIDHWSKAMAASEPDAVIDATWAIVVTEANEGMFRALGSCRTSGLKLTERTANNLFETFTAGLTQSVEALFRRSGLQATTPASELGQVLAATVHGIGQHLDAGARAGDWEGTYAAVWLGLLALTRPAGAGTR